MAEYFLGINGSQHGPFPEQELVARGMRHDSLIWRDGMASWVRADQLPEMIQYLDAIGRPPQTQFGAYTNPASNPGNQYGPDGVPLNPYAGPTGGGAPQGYSGPYQQPPQVSYVSAPYQPNPYYQHSSNRVAAGVFAILMGALGVHKFMLGYTGTGFIMLLGSILSCGFLAPVFGIIGLVEGIIYLTKTDEQFVETYQARSRTWF